MSTDVCEQCGGPLRGQQGAEICYECLASRTLKFLDDPEASSTLLSSGERQEARSFGDYAILGELARGGMGVVYRARRTGTDQVVALKVIHSGPICSLRTEARFMTEIESAAALSHPHIVPILDVGTCDEMPFYTMKLIEGGSLADVEDRRFDRQSLRHSVERLVKVAEAVHFAHEHGIIHRDLKPSNVLLDEAGEPYVSDFGLAKRLDDQSDLTLTGEVLGTPSFMAPEQTKGSRSDQTIAVDVYSLGALLYHSITGKAPFAGDTAFETLKQIESQDVVPPSQFHQTIDQDLETIVLKGLEKEASQRYASALALAADLERWLEGRPVLAHRSSRWESARKWVRRRPYAAALIAMSVLSLSLLGGQAWNNYRRSQKEQAQIQDLSHRLADSLVASRLQIAEDWLQRGGLGEAIAHLAANLRDQPGAIASFAYAKNLMSAGAIPSPLSPPLKHNDEIWSVDFHPDGDRVITACFDGFGRIWSLSKPEAPLFELPHAMGVYRVDLDAVNSRVLTGSVDGTARVWDLETGRPVSPYLKHEGGVQVAGFLEGGGQFVTACVGAVVRVWDAHEFAKPLAELRLPKREQIAHIAVPIPGFRDRLMVGSVRGNLWVWQWTTGTVLHKFSSGSPYLSDCVFSPDGERMISLGNHDTTGLWSTETWSRVASLPHSADPWSVVYAHSGHSLVTCGEDGYYFWDQSTGAALASRSVLASEEALSTVRSRIRASASRELWYTFNNSSVFFLDERGYPAGIPSFSIPAVIHDVDPDPYSDRIAVRTFDGWLQVWKVPEVSTSDRVYRTPASWEANHAQFTEGEQGEQQLIVGSTGRPELRSVSLTGTNEVKNVLSPSRSQNLSEIREADAKKHVVVVGEDMWLQVHDIAKAAQTPGEEEEVLLTPSRHCMVSSDDRWVFTLNRDSRPTVIDLNGDRQPLALESDLDVHRFCFSPESELLALASYDGVIEVFRLVDQRQIGRHLGLGRQPEALAISPEQDHVAVGHNDGMIAVFDLNGEVTVRWERKVKDGIVLVKFAPNGSQVAVGTAAGTVEIRDPQSGERLSTNIRHRTAITNLRFVADGKALMVASYDKTLRFWDPTTGYPLTESIVWGGSAAAIDLSADGRFYSFGVGDGQVEVRRVPSVLDVTSFPDWVVAFAGAVGGFRLEENETLGLIPWEERVAIMDAVRTMDANEPLVGWAHSVMDRRGY